MLFPPLSIHVDGVTFETVNWSFGGFMVEGAKVKRRIGDIVTGAIGWDSRPFPFSGRVNRSGGEAHELAVSFTEISDEALLYLDNLVSEFLSNKRK